MLGSFWIRSLPVALIALGAYVVAAVVLLPGWRYPLACLGFTSIAAVTIVYSTWRLGGHDIEEAITAGVRIVVLAWPGSVMAGYVDPSRLADYLAQTLRLPARMIAAFAAALQRFTGFGLAWQQLERVRWVRGFGPTPQSGRQRSLCRQHLVRAARAGDARSIRVGDRDGRARVRDGAGPYVGRAGAVDATRHRRARRRCAARRRRDRCPPPDLT